MEKRNDGNELLEADVILAALDGDAEAMELILKEYEGWIRYTFDKKIKKKQLNKKLMPLEDME